MNQFYLRSPEIIEKISKVNHIVFDKTGTITQIQGSNVKYSGKLLNPEMRIIIVSLLKQNTHPTSQIIEAFLKEEETIKINHFKEIQGQGIEGWVNEKHIKIGSPQFVGKTFTQSTHGTKVVISIDGQVFGEFLISNKYRFGISRLIQRLKKNFTLSLISGDNDHEIETIQSLLGEESEIYFNQSPLQKLEYIKQLQEHYNLNVMMVGDGLNDAGALKQSEVGIAVADTSNSFTPSSDGVLDASKLNHLDTFIRLARVGKYIILFSFTISVLYNIIGLYYALQGILSPVVAAILMPASSITIILLSYGLTEIFAGHFSLKNRWNIFTNQTIDHDSE